MYLWSLRLQSKLKGLYCIYRGEEISKKRTRRNGRPFCAHKAWIKGDNLSGEVEKYFWILKVKKGGTEDEMEKMVCKGSRGCCSP
jgi:hypothetical protein